MNEFSSTRSPINEFPIEILCETFSRCVDQSSAHLLMQPSATIAPMLLCQVCATWRAVALSEPSLWSHLRFELPLNWHPNGRPFTWDPEAFVHRLEWLRWWKRNLGSMAPYLQVELRQNVGSIYRRGRLSEPASEFLLELMSSAQYLSVGRLYRYLVQRRTEAGYMAKVHPSAHTIVAIWSTVSEFDGPDACQQYLTSVLTQTRSTLRHLVIEDTRLGHEDLMNPLHKWSTLTHLSMHLMFLNLNTWFSFIRSLSALQSGSFRLSLLDNDIETYVRPPVGTLPYAFSFDVSASLSGRNTGQYPLKAVFDNLRLPALRTLSLESRATTWYDSTAITEVHASLLSAPAITKLSLGMLFLGGQAYHSTPEYFGRTPIRSDIEPLVTYAPRLEHLSFLMWSPLRRHGGFQFIERVFASSRWLDLKRPTSTIREVILMSSTLQQSQTVAEHVDRSLFISEVRRLVKDEVTVRFEEEGSAEVRRAAWGW